MQKHQKVLLHQFLMLLGLIVGPIIKLKIKGTGNVYILGPDFNNSYYPNIISITKFLARFFFFQIFPFFFFSFLLNENKSSENVINSKIIKKVKKKKDEITQMETELQKGEFL